MVHIKCFLLGLQCMTGCEVCQESVDAQAQADKHPSALLLCNAEEAI